MTSARGAAILAMAALAALGLLTGCGSSSETPAAGAGAESAVSTPPPSPSPSPRTSGPGAAVRTRDAGLPTITEVAEPIRLRIESAKLDLQIKAVGVAKDGQMELPPNPSVVGWYKFGPAPVDDKGSVVLGGHLDSKEFGKGPLVRLRKLRAGDVITVASTDNSVNRYRVRKVEDIPKTKLAVGDLFDRQGIRQLRLVTCGGPYDSNGGGYRDNVVVTATAM